jgi:hypothetical protein
MSKALTNAFLELMENKKKRIELGKTIRMKDIGRKGHHIFECEAFTYLQQHNSLEKYFIFERLKRIRIDGVKVNAKLKVTDIEYRISYYIVGKNGTKKGKWTFGQFCPTIPPQDFEKLIKKAKLDKVIIG